MNPLRWRKMTWTLWVWTTIMFIWMIGGAATANNAKHCATDSAVVSGILTQHQCTEASNAGTGIGVGLVFFLWFLGFVVLGLVWFMTRRKGRVCPVCGDDVKRGFTACKACGHDFKAALTPAAVSS
jgi:hypothetical protein